MGAGVGDESAEFCGVVRPLRVLLVIRPVRRTYVVLRQADELLCGGHKWVPRFEALYICFALGGEVSVEWSRCPGSMARRSKDSLAPLRRNSADWMPARIGRLSAGVGRRHPVANRKASLMAGSIRRV